MSFCKIALTLTSVFCVVTSQQGADNAVNLLNSIMGGGSSVSSSNILSAIGSGTGDSHTGTMLPATPVKLETELVLRQFTLEAARRMVHGTETGGLLFNLQGLPASDGQATFSLAQLKSYVQQLEAQSGGASDATDIQSMPDISRGTSIDAGIQSIGQFTLEQVRAMITGMQGGVLYNYQGQPATQGQATLTFEQLQRFLNELLSKGMHKSVDFTRADLDRMIVGMQNGLVYNLQGQIASPGEIPITLDQLNQLLASFNDKDSMAAGTQTPQFTLADVNRMITGMNQGFVYNFRGVQAAAGEPTITREQLNTLLNNLNAQTGSMAAGMPIPQFTLVDVNRMIDGMNRGLVYNYRGVQAAAGESTITREQLNTLLNNLNAQTGSMAAGTQTTQFTLADVNRMIDGMSRGLVFNYRGVQAAAGEPTITREQLNTLLNNLNAQTGSMAAGTQTPQFTLVDVNRMIDGMNRGLAYNYRGVQAAAGEPTITREQLNTLLNNLNAQRGIGGSQGTASFTIDDINRMISGMNRGLVYNYRGVEAASGEAKLTREQLNKVLADLTAKGSMATGTQTPRFTLADVNRMIDGMNRGLVYNHRGVQAAAGEPTITREQLNTLVNKLNAQAGSMAAGTQTPQFTLADVNRMITGMDQGLVYNFRGVQAAAGEPTITREQLNTLLNNLNAQTGSMAAGTQTPQFTLADINRMITGMNRGLVYNFRGVQAAAGEPTITREQLNTLLNKLNAQTVAAGTQTPQFTLVDVNRMIDGMNRGLVYNYRGVQAAAGEPTITREQLNTLLNNLNAQTGIGGSPRTASFTIDDINRMISGMNQGLVYNNLGVEAAPGEATLTREQLNKVLADLTAKETGITRTTTSFTSDNSTMHTSFTFDDVNRMLAGMDRGLIYNYQGVEAAPGDVTLTREQLNQLKSDPNSKVTIDRSKSSTRSNITDSKQTTGTGADGATFNSSSSSTSVRSSSSSETSVLFDTPSGGEESNLVDLNLLATGTGAKVPTGPTETAAFAEANRETILPGTGVNTQGINMPTHVTTASSTETDPGANQIDPSSIQTGTFTTQTGTLSTQPGTLPIQTGTLTTQSGTLPIQTGTLTTQSGTLSIQTGTLTTQSGTLPIQTGTLTTQSGTLPIQTGTLTTQSGTLPIQTGTLTTQAGTLPVQTGTLTTQSGTLSTQTGTLTTQPGTLPIQTGTVSTQTGTLPIQTGTVSTQIGTLPRQTGTLTTQSGTLPTQTGTSSAQIGTLLPIQTGTLSIQPVTISTQPGTLSTHTSTLHTIQTDQSSTQTGPSLTQTDPSSIQTDPSSTQTDQSSTQTDPSLTQTDTSSIQTDPSSTQTGILTSPNKKDAKSTLSIDTRAGLDGINIGGLADEIGTVNIIIGGTVGEIASGLAATSGDIGSDPAAISGDIGGDPATKSSDPASDSTASTDTTSTHVGFEVHKSIATKTNTTKTNISETTVTKTTKTGHGTLGLTANFSIGDLQRMINDMKTGASFNYQGTPAASGDPLLSMDQLNDLLGNLQTASATTDPMAKHFTLGELQLMISGMELGLRYNYQGSLAGPGEQNMTREQLQQLFINLLQNNFAVDDINRMLTGLDKGESYNLQGKQATAGDPTLSREQLNQLLNILTVAATARPLMKQFALGELQLMISGMEQGLRYGYQGVPAGPGEQTLTMEQLQQLYIHLLSGNFGVDDINRMLTGLDKGEAYTLQGKLATAGEPTLSRDQLNQLLNTLTGAAAPKAQNFTLGKLQMMLSGMENGSSYNLAGIQAAPGEKTVAADQLQQLLIDVAKPSYNLNSVNAMLTGMDEGKSYNFGGQAAGIGEWTWTYDLLERLVIYFLNQKYANVALNKPAEISSVFDPRWDADKGVDGNRKQNVNENSCFHTQNQLEPSFIVDLGAIYKLNSIVLFNRLDCCDDRAKDLQISTGYTKNDMTFRNSVAGSIGSIARIPLAGEPYARYIKIQSTNKDPTYLHLCEVEVYGTYAAEDYCIGQPCLSGGTCTYDGPGGFCTCMIGYTGVKCETKMRTNVALNKRAELSSVYDPLWSADKGVDGDTSQDINLNSCFHTRQEVEPYFIVDLGGVYDLEGLQIYNRQDCCDDRAKNIEIYTGLTRDDFVPREFITGPLLSQTNIPLNGPVQAQFVKIQIKGVQRTFLHLCEIQVFGKFLRDDACAVNPCLNGGICTNTGGSDNCRCTGVWSGPTCSDRLRPNIALGKNAEMSSNFNSMWIADRAVDGNTNQDMDGGSCFHTQEETRPYWRVDLGAVYDIDQVEIYNRGDCCDDRLKNLAISTGLTRDNLELQQLIKGPLQSQTTVPMVPISRAQFVELQNRDNTPTFLHVCEVKITGNFVREDLCAISPCLNGGTCTNQVGGNLCRCTDEWSGSHCQTSTNNIALGKPAQLSSLFNNDVGYAGSKGVDGNPNTDMNQGSCFSTQRQRQPYWMIDLGAVYELQYMVLTNREDCCTERATDIEITAGLTKEDLVQIYFHEGEMGNKREIPITSGTEGQFVMIQIKDLQPQYLHLCEVEIYGLYVRQDQCLNNPCKNGGTCRNMFGQANCVCLPGWTGYTCDRNETRPYQPLPRPDITGQQDPEWLKSRVDPAPCRIHSCNLPICYVPHEHDCKSYIVCQRTSLGTYVAWKMRCAFGSYWGTGKIWTCERVEDLAIQGYMCPNDRCQDPSVQTYQDEDIKNCRTYWFCENGISRPACCPPGQRFDNTTLKCEKDPHEMCRSPCPLKIEGCAARGARTQPLYDGNCRTYWNCGSGHPHPVCCQSGMSYDSIRGICIDDITCSDTCPPEYNQNVCGKISHGNPVQSYALADGNCRTYMKCNSEEGYDDPYCCRRDYTYDVKTARCERVTNLYDRCSYEACPIGYREECRFSSVADNPTQFYDNDADIIRDCAPATAFAADICTCTGNSFINVCRAEVWAKFDNAQDRWNVKNHGDGWISVFGDMSKNKTAQGITYGTFDGSSGMEVWRYDHTALPEVTLEITFQPVASGIDKQILVSNCMSIDNLQPSFEVSLDPRSSRIVFNGKSKFDAVEISLPYNTQGWNMFKLFFDGEHLVGLVEDPAGVGKTEMQSANLRGEITAGVGALKFGPCLDAFSMPMNNGFTGFISEVIFSKCIDSRGRDFILQRVIPEKRRTPARH